MLYSWILCGHFWPDFSLGHFQPFCSVGFPGRRSARVVWSYFLVGFLQPITHESRVNKSRKPGCSSSFSIGFLHVVIFVKLFRLYIKWSLSLKHFVLEGVM